MLLIVIMSIACGYPAYREIEQFAKANSERLPKYFFSDKKECSLMSPSEIWYSILILNIFIRYLRTGPDSMSASVSLVSVFSLKRGQVVGFDILHNKKSSEIPTAGGLIRLLDLKHVVFTTDALHCQKKTLKTIVETDNDHVIKVKGNQPKLLESVRRKSEISAPTDVCETVEKNRGRLEIREVSVFGPPSDISENWAGVGRVICVRRLFETPEKSNITIRYYISSIISNSAEFFAHGIRGHWHIENRLHYVRDVVMNEDISGIRNLDAAANMPVFRNIAINIARGNGFDSVKKASIFSLPTS